MVVGDDAGSSERSKASDMGATFGDRVRAKGAALASAEKPASTDRVRSTAGGMEMTFVPTGRSDRESAMEGAKEAREVKKAKGGKQSFGAGMEKGGADPNEAAADDASY